MRERDWGRECMQGPGIKPRAGWGGRHDRGVAEDLVDPYPNYLRKEMVEADRLGINCVRFAHKWVQDQDGRTREIKSLSSANVVKLVQHPSRSIGRTVPTLISLSLPSAKVGTSSKLS